MQMTEPPDRMSLWCNIKLGLCKAVCKQVHIDIHHSSTSTHSGCLSAHSDCLCVDEHRLLRAVFGACELVSIFTTRSFLSENNLHILCTEANDAPDLPDADCYLFWQRYSSWIALHPEQWVALNLMRWGCVQSVASVYMGLMCGIDSLYLRCLNDDIWYLSTTRRASVLQLLVSVQCMWIHSFFRGY